MAETNILTRQEIFDRFDVNDEEGTVTDSKTGLMWTLELVFGQWSNHPDGLDAPDGSLFTEAVWNKNFKLNKARHIPAPPITHSETGTFTDHYPSEPIDIPDPEAPRAYTDWRVPDVEELTEFQTYFQYIWYDDVEGGPNDAKSISIEGKTYGEPTRFFWTSSLVRKKQTDLAKPTHMAWAVASTEKSGETDIEAEKPSKRATGTQKLEKPVVKKFATTEKMATRLVRGAEKVHPDPDA